VQTFKAYRTFQDEKAVVSRFVDMKEDELDAGDVLIRTKYSTINYKDALSYNGTGRIMRKYPTVAGIDMAGTVERSNDPRWKRGDKVIVTGYDLGVAHDGGYAELVRVPADWVVRRPESMTAFDAMTLGTAGFTAALAIHLMEHNGLKPENGRVAVTGATGGVGSVATEILAKEGYNVVAITGKEEPSTCEYRRQEVCCASRSTSPIKPLDRRRGWRDRQPRRRHPAWLSTSRSTAQWPRSVSRRTQAHHVRRAVHPARRALLGVDSGAPMNAEAGTSRREWRPDRVHDLVRTIDFDELPSISTRT
jgi:NADPH2:quinone reductase